MARTDAGLVGRELQEVTRCVNRLHLFGTSVDRFLQAPRLPADIGVRNWPDLPEAAQHTWAEDFGRLILVERRVPSADVLSVLSPATAETLQRAIDGYRDTVPLTVGEREWLLSRYAQFEASQAGVEHHFDFIEHLRELEAEASRHRGRRQYVLGAEVIHNWWDWRRGGGDYAGRDRGFTRSQTAARRIAGLLAR